MYVPASYAAVLAEGLDLRDLLYRVCLAAEAGDPPDAPWPLLRDLLSNPEVPGGESSRALRVLRRLHTTGFTHPSSHTWVRVAMERESETPGEVSFAGGPRLAQAWLDLLPRVVDEASARLVRAIMLEPGYGDGAAEAQRQAARVLLRQPAPPACLSDREIAKAQRVDRGVDYDEDDEAEEEGDEGGGGIRIGGFTCHFASPRKRCPHCGHVSGGLFDW